MAPNWNPWINDQDVLRALKSYSDKLQESQALNQLAAMSQTSHRTTNMKLASFSSPGKQDIPIENGTEVVLISGEGSHGGDQANPRWGENGVYIKGTIIGFAMNYSRRAVEVAVTWDSGMQNLYAVPSSDSELIPYAWAQKPKKGVFEKAVVFDATALDPLVLGTKVKQEIVAVLKQHQHVDKLFTEWGLSETIEYGRGMTFMFYGKPGTGKTWGAKCIARSLGQELLVVSAAEIQSSEPGGANRAIQNAFAEASSKKKVLFLDECDSLITQRNDVGMILASEINTLLTEIEKFEGVAILATNRIDTMDEALERRIALIVEFPFPDETARRAIWEKLIPAKMPLSEDVSKESLAKHPLSGGQIKNILLQAARLALSEDAPAVTGVHFEQAIARFKKTKGLMGNRSRYNQRADYSKSGGIKSKDLDALLDEDDED